MEQAYAQALLRMVEGGKKPQEAVQALKALLTSRGRLSLLPKISTAFKRLSMRKEGRNKMTLSVAREKDMKAALKEAKSVLAEQKKADVELCEEVDESLIGGWRLEGNGILVESSWKKDLLSIYNRATQ